jgi:hypothetical protein
MDISSEFETVCAHCGHHHNATDRVTADGVPTNGAIIFCVGCGQWNIFASRRPGRLRRPSIDELRQIRRNPIATEMSKVWRIEMAQRRFNGA